MWTCARAYFLTSHPLRAPEVNNQARLRVVGLEGVNVVEVCCWGVG
jgi:hypothetical protein